MRAFQGNEKYLSQIPALQELIVLGYDYLSPEEVLSLRDGKKSHVLLENILRKQLTKMNTIHYRGKDYWFSEANIQEAIQKLNNVKYDGLRKTNEMIYDMLTLGIALEQTVEGNTRSFNLNYIDWKRPENNVFHVTAEYVVERTRSTETTRPDIVLFVNGIPLVVIECKAPKVEIDQAISQMIRNQGDDYIPKLFTFVQLVIGMNKNSAKYATIDTAKKFWSSWNNHYL
jgi:type I restriction enzyme R subunit